MSPDHESRHLFYGTTGLIFPLSELSVGGTWTIDVTSVGCCPDPSCDWGTASLRLLDKSAPICGPWRGSVCQYFKAERSMLVHGFNIFRPLQHTDAPLPHPSITPVSPVYTLQGLLRKRIAFKYFICGFIGFGSVCWYDSRYRQAYCFLGCNVV